MHKLTSATDVAAHTLYDPQALKGLGDITDWKKFKSWALGGHLVEYSTHSDGQAMFWVYVDEEPDAVTLARAIPSRHAGELLVPSGVLWASGAEHLHAAETENAARDFKIPIKHMGTRIEVPPGRYAVQCYAARLNDYDEEMEMRVLRLLTPDEKKRRIKEQSRQTMGIFLIPVLILIWLLAVPKAWKSESFLLFAVLSLSYWLAISKLKDKTLAAKFEAVKQEYEAASFDLLVVLKKTDKSKPGPHEGNFIQDT